MKKFFKLTITFITVLLVAFVVFFFWASSPNLSEREYARLIVNENLVESERDSIYSIMTYNIGYLSGMTNNRAVEKPRSLFDSNLIKVKKELQKVNPDIIAFQEIDFASARSYEINQQEEIATLGYNYIAQTINWDETYVPFPYYPFSMHFGKLISGQSILSKFPLKEHQRIVLQRDESNPFYRDAFYLERLAQVTKVDIEGKEMVVINVHLDAFSYDTRVKQFRTVMDLFEKYASTYPVILLGDFNSHPYYENAVIHDLLNNESIGNAAFQKENFDLTFNTAQPFERLDYIFYTKKAIKLVDAKVLNEFGQASDHFPVMMRFRLE